MKEEVVRLGVELSLHVAGSMFYLSDDIYNMLRFCYKLLEDARKDLAHNSPVMKSMIGVIHYVNSKYIKPKNGVCQNEVEEAISMAESLRLVLKEVDETLRCAKDVLEANGFVRDAMESKILDLWKPLFDKETEEAWSLNAVRLGIFF
ncbi:hypothetical protein ISN44_As08g027010 [Arabidopsis suecica]|uniref:Uncharacterized protein n=1 Tax=Arabidopsis suecica TaxID=45249 RepID=A0A8T2BAT0_ARASU|nr:hypothetical protein ISN44_As08g027010 [Arabidopsis suecica]